MKNKSSKLIERLTLYHCVLTHTIHKSEYISSSEIAKLLKLDDSQVRKDIASCNVLGKPKQGYLIKDLKQNIEKKLSYKKEKKVIIIGAGNLGTALSKYTDFKDYGIHISAIFDIKVQKVGTKIEDKEVMSIEKLQEFILREKIKTAILAVPPNQAQEIALNLINYGIKFIWNFTPCVLDVPENIIVHYENIISGFLQMHNL